LLARLVEDRRVFLSLFRHSARDALLIALAAAYGALLLAAPSAPVVAIGLWWTANTVAHNFIHLPFFRARAANRAFSIYLSLLLGLPQTLWRDRHLAHHAGRAWRLRPTRQLEVELLVVAALWIALAWSSPGYLLAAWLPGWLGGLVMCQLQGYYEHARGTVSHRGRLYNVAFFNDGYHVEHHAHPSRHWSELPHYVDRAAPVSRWPAVLRWLERCNLDGLERLVLRSRALQRYVVARHARAFGRLLAAVPTTRRVTVVGGGLFPRTMLVLRQLIPAAEITIVDRSRENLEVAKGFFEGSVRAIEADFAPQHCVGADLLVVPLAFRGDRAAFYVDPPAPAVAIHDWIWRRRGTGYVVSLLLLKRLNLVRQ
jgi:hypothetical protein